jgi:hypothetical protein
MSRETALVTGASSGIGTAFARRLAARGMDLILAARREERLRALKEEIERTQPVRAQVVRADLGVAGGAEGLFARAQEEGWRVDWLVNNAGFGLYGTLVDQDAERLRQMIELNVTAVTVLTQLFAREMVKRGSGRVLQVSSIGAYQPSPYYAAYSATKAYVLFLSEAVNYELRGTGVTVTTLCPGLTATEFHEVAAHVKSDRFMRTAMTADQVAAIGIGAALKGRAVVTAGLTNQLLGGVVKVLPRSMATAAAAATMRNASADPAQRQLTPGANR